MTTETPRKRRHPSPSTPRSRASWGRGGTWTCFGLEVPSPGGFLTIVLDTGWSIDTTLHLADGTTQSSTRSGLYTSRIVTSLVPGGTYLVAVRGRDCAEAPVCVLGESVGGYELAVEFASDRPDDHGDTPDKATHIELNSSTDGALEVAGDVDFFRLQIPQSGGYLAIRSAGEPNAVGALYLPDGSIRRSDYGEDFAIFTNRLAGGIHYVSVEGACLLSCDTGPYALQVLFSTDAGVLREMLRQ